ncbi:MAG: hypothetical protein HQL34_08520, partial [Alphaproteobacteria bacterium]|nr:hypothetical protein [Alphaproteobacteria bacterium]
IGGVLGAIGGGLAGAQIGGGTGRASAIGAGVLLGTWIGRSIGASLDRADWACRDWAYGAGPGTDSGAARLVPPLVTAPRWSPPLYAETGRALGFVSSVPTGPRSAGGYSPGYVMLSSVPAP